MTSMERTLQALSHEEPDRVPLFLLLSHYGAKFSNMPISEYFSSPEAVIKAQIEMRQKFKSDCYYTFTYAAAETEAMGGEVIYQDESPPNAGDPTIFNSDDIKRLKVPEISKSKSLNRVLEITRGLFSASAGEVPIIGVVMSPFSLPVMQLGFERYLNILYTNQNAFHQLMEKNREFCVNWANEQLDAGATAICYFNPLASVQMIEPELYKKTGFIVDLETTSRIEGPIATHLASGIVEPSFNNILETGSAVIGISQQDNLHSLKSKAQGKITLLGNLNGIELVHSSKNELEKSVKLLMRDAGSGGGLIISDNHGEIPWQVPEDVLCSLGEIVNRIGRYTS